MPVGLRDRGEGDAGTLDAPRRLVAVGPYRWVRDPINIASLLIVIPGGLAVPLAAAARVCSWSAAISFHFVRNRL